MYSIENMIIIATSGNVPCEQRWHGITGELKMIGWPDLCWPESVIYDAEVNMEQATVTQHWGVNGKNKGENTPIPWALFASQNSLVCSLQLGNPHADFGIKGLSQFL